MSLHFRPLNEVIGAEVLGVDLSQPMSDETFERVHQTWLERTILLFREQKMSVEEHIAFTRRLGDLEIHTLPKYNLPYHPEIFVVSNVTKDGRPIGAPKSGHHWHSDSQYLKKPSAGSLLHAREVPAEGATPCSPISSPPTTHCPRRRSGRSRGSRSCTAASKPGRSATPTVLR